MRTRIATHRFSFRIAVLMLSSHLLVIAGCAGPIPDPAKPLSDVEIAEALNAMIVQWYGTDEKEMGNEPDKASVTVWFMPYDDAEGCPTCRSCPPDFMPQFPGIKFTRAKNWDDVGDRLRENDRGLMIGWCSIGESGILYVTSFITNEGDTATVSYDLRRVGGRWVATFAGLQS